MDMESVPRNSTDFVLMGLITHPVFPGIIFAVVFSIFVLAVTANVVMILLIRVDSRLHMPMYFLLNLLSKEKTISFLGCALQIFLYLTLIGAEFFLLGLMACDRCVAVCSPLHYPALMNCRICLLMAVGSWVGGSLDGFMLTPVAVSFPCCGSRAISHFCEIPAVLRLCETLTCARCTLMLLVPSWAPPPERSLLAWPVCRGWAPRPRPSPPPRWPRVFCGAAFHAPVLPHSCHTPEKDEVVSAFYTVLAPMLYC
uniref:G-protein coupled receptors family 1 profile domain-containing protein n=1 Tax=Microcebus murinus TaxID=30608 RepID=A0A8C5W0P3_MICMU